MKKLTTYLFILMIASLILASGCSGNGGNTSDPNRGFDILTYAVYPSNPTYPNGLVISTAGNVQGEFQDGSGTNGTVTSFNRNVGGVGVLEITGAKVPGRWRLALGPGFDPSSQCLTYNIEDRNVNRLGALENLYCQGRFFGYTASPDTVDTSGPSVTASFMGEGIDSTYGMPVLAYYDYQGYIASSTTATSLITKGTEIRGVQASTSDLAQAYNGNHTVVIHNRKSDGSLEAIGAAIMVVIGNPPPPPPPPGGDDCGPPPPPSEPQLPCNQS